MLIGIKKEEEERAPELLFNYNEQNFKQTFNETLINEFQQLLLKIFKIYLISLDSSINCFLIFVFNILKI